MTGCAPLHQLLAAVAVTSICCTGNWLLSWLTVGVARCEIEHSKSWMVYQLVSGTCCTIEAGALDLVLRQGPPPSSLDAGFTALQAPPRLQ